MIRRKIWDLRDHYEILKETMENELNKKGIFTLGTYKDIEYKFRMIDFLEPAYPTIDQQEKTVTYLKDTDFNTVGFSSFFLALQCVKRNEKFDTRGLSQKQLLEELRKTEKGSSFLGIMARYKTLDKVPVSDLIETLKRYCNGYDLDQSDIEYQTNLFIFTRNIWKKVYREIDKLEFKDLYVLISSMETFHHKFGMDYSEKTKNVPVKYLSKVVERALETLNKSNLYHLCVFTSGIQKLFPNKFFNELHIFQAEIINHPFITDNLTKEELALVIQNLPLNSFISNQDQVKIYIKKWEGLLENYCFYDKINGLLGIHRSGHPISQKIFDSVSDFEDDLVDTLEFRTVTQVIEVFAENKQLTDFIAESLFKWFELNMEISKSSFESIARMVYNVYHNGYLIFLLKQPTPFLRLMNPIGPMSLESLLKFSIVFAPTMIQNDEFYELVKRTFLRTGFLDKEIQPVIHLITELQEGLLESCREFPIFNYQIDSFETLFSRHKIVVVDYLHYFIQLYNPNTHVKLKYYSDFVYAKMPKISDFEKGLSKESFLFACKAVWRFKPGDEVYQQVLTKGFEIFNINHEDCTEWIYYLNSCKPINDLVKYAKFNRSSVFYLAVCYDCGIDPEVTEELSLNLRQDTDLFGEPLLKSILVSIQKNLDPAVLRILYKKLTYVPGNSVKIDEELKKKVVREIMTAGKGIDLFVFSIFVNQNLSIFSVEEIQSLAQFFLPHLQEVFPAFKQSLECLGLLGRNCAAIYPDRDLKSTLELSGSQEENLKIMREIIKGSRLNKVFIEAFLNSLKKSENKGFVLEGVSLFLELISLFGNLFNYFEPVYQIIQKFELIPSFSQKDLTNFLFICTMTDPPQPVPINSLIPLFLSSQKETQKNDLKTHSNNLQYYLPFKYNTFYETRYFVSNDEDLSIQKPAYFSQAPLSREDFLECLKSFLLLLYFQAPENPEITQKIDYYFYHKSLLKDFVRSVIEVQALFEYKHRLIGAGSSLKSEKTLLSCLNEILLTFENSKKAVILLDQDMFIINQKDEVMCELLPVKKLVEYIKKSFGLEIECFNIRRSLGIPNSDAHPFIDFFSDRNFYYSPHPLASELDK